MEPSRAPVTIERATADDGQAILQLLAGAALEIYADGALLRSVVVDARAKGQGIGTGITKAALDLASELGTPAVYLLTTTAEEFFPKFAFLRIGRSEVPKSVQKSVEFSSACPSTAIVMRRTLNQD